MSHVTDVVCEMAMQTETAPEKSTFRGQTYYFCSTDCRRLFQSDPAAYVGAEQTHAALPHETKLERHEPPYTKASGLVAPKFGSAGSGGAEYEQLPEAHDIQESGSEKAADA